MDTSLDLALPISAVERETGISKDVLRKWESRYGFPAPLRDSQGERAYPPDQVNRLRLIKRLMDTGMRPSRIVTESEANLTALAQASQREPNTTWLDRVEDLTLAKLCEEDPAGLRRRLYRELLRQGLDTFVQDTLTPLSYAVGDAWARGEISIHEEHLYTEVVQDILRDTVNQLNERDGRPRVLLTTLPEEQHGIGIIMAAAVLSLRGAYCISLGTQTPVQSIAQAAEAHDANIVAVSFSNAYPQRRILPALTELRQRLAPGLELWAGGSGCRRLTVSEDVARLAPELSQLLEALSAWRQAAGPSPARAEARTG
jgi:DNA-binding transcriptional MerR regulator/methylmalonyl-CoA mutase cobalamin-binding subunit